MQDLVKKVENWKIHYYKPFPTNLKKNSTENQARNEDIFGLVFLKKDEQITDEEMINVSKNIQNIALIFTQKSQFPQYDYELSFFFNGLKIKFFSYAVFGLLRFLYDSKIFKHNYRFKIGNLELKGSSIPDKNLNFYIKYNEPSINELSVSVFDFLACLSINAEKLSPNFKIYEIKSPFVNVVPIPLSSQSSLEKIKYSTGSIINLKRNFEELPSIHTYFSLGEEKIIRSRFLNTNSIIMEYPASPIACSLLHYFLMKIYNQFNYDEVIHYQGININKSNRLITRLEVDVTNSINLVSGGKCIPIIPSK